MPTTRSSRSFSSPPQRIWEIVADPHHLPRWWPRVQRVEGVDEHGFTQVLRSGRGHSVRADYRIAEFAPPRRCRWEQELEGTPFERILRRSEIALELEPDEAGGTALTIVLTQALAGMSRFGAFMVRRAARAQLDEALEALERIHA